MAWDQNFSDPIEVPDGRKLLTLRDAANYIVKLPEADQAAAKWQAAAEVLMLIGEHGDDPMMARIGMMRGLNRHIPRTAPQRKVLKTYRIVR